MPWFGWASIAIYLSGWFVAATFAARYWFREFRVELEGAAWGAFVAILWPLWLPMYLVALLIKNAVAHAF